MTVATTWNNLRSSDDGGPSEPEPTTVREAQLWLHHKGYGECTEDDAKHVLFIRRQVREGRCSDD